MITITLFHHTFTFSSLYSSFEKLSARTEYVRRGRFLSLPRHHIPPLKGARGMLFPIAYALRPMTYSSFFRLETPFLPFFVPLYYAMNQPLIYPSYTNRPRFV